MKTFLPRLALVASMLALPLFGRAAVPATLGFVARIADQGQPVSGSHDFTFTLWNDLTASDTTNQLWTEAQTGLTVNDGVVVATLGATTAIDPAAVFAGGTVYLEIAYDGVALSPRLQVVSVPYAMVAGSLATPSALSCKTVSADNSLGNSKSCIRACEFIISTSMAAESPTTAVATPIILTCNYCLSAPCETGYVVTGGGYTVPTGLAVTQSGPSGETRWGIDATNTSGSAVNVTVTARCCKVQ